MKTTRQAVYLMIAVAVLAGCSKRHVRPAIAAEPIAPESRQFEPMEVKYDESRSPTWNFSNLMRATAWHCALEAETGYSIRDVNRRMGQLSTAEANRLGECKRDAYKRGEEAVRKLKQSSPAPKLMELSKDVYSKWKTYMDSMSVYEPKNLQAETQFQAALSTEEQFLQ